MTTSVKYDFTGKERDIETGLHYFGARYYDSDLGRWLQVDPLADKYPGWSPYNYCVNNPVRLVDPDGKEVKVYSERLTARTLSNGGGINGLASVGKPQHSFLRVTTDKYDVIIELGGPRNGRTTGTPLLQNVSGKLPEREEQKEGKVFRPKGIGEKDYAQFEDKIIALFNEIKDNLPDYNAFGPNCNGFIRFLIETTGGGVELPGGSYFSNEIKGYWEKYKQIHKKNEEDDKKKNDQ